MENNIHVYNKGVGRRFTFFPMPENVPLPQLLRHDCKDRVQVTECDGMNRIELMIKQTF